MVEEYDNGYLGYVGNPFNEGDTNDDIVWLWLYKDNNNIKEYYGLLDKDIEVIGEPKEIWNYENDKEYIMENEAKIRKLLKEYGAEEKEIENFMNDLK